MLFEVTIFVMPSSSVVEKGIKLDTLNEQLMIYGNKPVFKFYKILKKKESNAFLNIKATLLVNC